MRLLTTAEIDALPDGTRFVNALSGEVAVKGRDFMCTDTRGGLRSWARACARDGCAREAKEDEYCSTECCRRVYGTQVLHEHREGGKRERGGCG